MTKKVAYLYLARRDKKGARLVTRLHSSRDLIARVPDIKVLGLPPNLEKSIEKVAQDNRMDWELWIATVDSYAALKKLLKKNGYSGISRSPVPEVIEVSDFKEINTSTKKLPPEPKIMVQRKFRS